MYISKMDKQFEILKITRQNMVKLLSACSEEQLLKIAPNYNNNIYWNAIHTLVTLQLLVYKMSGNEINVSTELVEAFRKGTMATDKIIMPVSELKEQLIATANKVEEDYNKGYLTEFSDYETSFGYTLKSVEDAICFNNTHEALHLGYMMAQRKAI